MSKPHLPGPAKQQALVASAMVLTGKKLDRHMLSVEAWQQEAWAHYDATGELRYAARYESNAISRAKLIAARIEPGDTAPQPLPDDHPATQIMADFLGGRDKQTTAIERLAVQLYISGISYLVGFDEKDPADRRRTRTRWKVMSHDEITVEHDRIRLRMGPGTTDLELDRGNVVIIRIWTPHARRWWEPDSAVRGVLPVLRELDGLTKHVGATIDSRLAGAGILVIPNEITFTSNRDDLEDDQDPFVVELIDAMMEPIEDRDTAAAVVPLVIKVPGEHASAIQHIRFGTEFDDQTRTLREEAIRRLALGLDIPPEILLGVGDVNHWTAWQIEESSVKLHIEPKLATICAGITEAFLHPALEVLGEDTEDIICWYDTTPLKLRPNRSDDAQNLHDDLLITDESRRKASGFGENDAPTPDEKFRMFIEHVLINSPQLSLNLLPVYAELIGADSQQVRRVIDEIEGDPEGVSNGADPAEADDTVTPRTDPADESPAAASATIHRI